MQSWARKLAIAAGLCWTALFILGLADGAYSWLTSIGRIPASRYLTVSFVVAVFSYIVYPAILIHALRRPEVRMAFETVPATIEAEMGEVPQ